MAQVQRTDINAYQGAARTYKFTITSDGSPWDFGSASSVKMTVRKSLDSESALFTIEASDGAGNNDWDAGVAEFVMTSTNSLLIDSDAVYDVVMEFSSTNKITPVFGDVLLQRKVFA